MFHCIFLGKGCDISELHFCFACKEMTCYICIISDTVLDDQTFMDNVTRMHMKQTQNSVSVNITMQPILNQGKSMKSSILPVVLYL